MDAGSSQIFCHGRFLKMVKQKALVSQYLENISREALEKYQNIIRRYVRRRQGVYALYRRKKLYYDFGNMNAPQVIGYL